jgi:hypothetical protein
MLRRTDVITSLRDEYIGSRTTIISAAADIIGPNLHEAFSFVFSLKHYSPPPKPRAAQRRGDLFASFFGGSKKNALHACAAQKRGYDYDENSHCIGQELR